MARIPEPQQTPAGPAYEGRLLANPAEEVVDQGLRFDLGTLATRRQVFSLAGIGAVALGLAACAPATSTTSSATTTAGGTTSEGEIPDETAGPYPGDGSNGPDVLEDSGIVRSDIRSSIDGGATATGVALTFSLALKDMLNADAPMEGAAVYAWHCDADGNYSMYSSGVTDETYLRGVQVAGADGTVTFTSIYPGCYSGRWPHIHFEVYPDVASITDSTNAIATSQIAMPLETNDLVYALSDYPNSARNQAQITLASDNVFGDDGGVLQLATVTGSVDAGYAATLDVRIDTSTAPTSGSAPASGMGGPGAVGGGPGH